jgi:hypothetical protein
MDMATIPRRFPMARFLSKSMSVLAALTICSASGAHWMLLQSVAWAGMVATFAQDRPLTQAVADALDGQHPCDMCKVIADGKSQERKSPQGTTPGASGKVLLYFLPQDLGLSRRSQRAEIFRIAENGDGRREAPPSPPPRLG